MLTTKPLAEKVKLNLVHYHFWSDVSILQYGNEFLLKGLPNHEQAININTPIRFEFVLPILKVTKITLENLESIFQGIQVVESVKPEKLILGIIDFDGTVVYYNVYSGVQKPKQS